MRTIKTLIITDVMGAGGLEPAEEAKEIAYLFKQLYDITLDWQHEEHAGTIEEHDPKLIIIDYGGMLPGQSTDVQQVTEVIKWAQDHPSRLVLIWTTFTARIWKFDLEDEFQDLDNVLLWRPFLDGSSYAPISFDEMDAYEKEVVLKLRHWYDLPAPRDLSEQYKIKNIKTPEGRRS